MLINVNNYSWFKIYAMGLISFLPISMWGMREKQEREIPTLFRLAARCLDNFLKEKKIFGDLSSVGVKEKESDFSNQAQYGTVLSSLRDKKVIDCSSYKVELINCLYLFQVLKKYYNIPQAELTPLLLYRIPICKIIHTIKNKETLLLKKRIKFRIAEHKLRKQSKKTDQELVEEVVSTIEEQTEINVSSSNFEQLPSEIGMFSWISILNASHNKFTTASLSSPCLESLSLLFLNCLDLSYNRIDEMPSELFKMHRLRVLIMNNNELRSIPKEIEKMQSLERLNVSSNQISEVSSSLFRLKDLRYLNIEYNKLTSIPLELQELSLKHPKISIAFQGNPLKEK